MNATTGQSLATCIGCGCDDLHACPDGCWWDRVDYGARKGVCSQCSELVPEWDAGKREPRAPDAETAFMFGL